MDPFLKCYRSNHDENNNPMCQKHTKYNMIDLLDFPIIKALASDESIQNSH